MQYIETITGGVDSISQNSMLNTPLPVAVFRADNGEIIWANDGFLALSGTEEDIFDLHIQDLAEGLDPRKAAEESAAASEELSAEAASLKQLVDQFTLASD